MKTPLAWHNLLHNRVKTSVAIAGVVFAIVLMFMQLGFLEAVKSSATLIYDVLDFDICIRSKDYVQLSNASNFPQLRLTQAASVAGVARADLFVISSHRWQSDTSGERRAILCFGVDPTAPIFLDPEIQQAIFQHLNRSDALLIDTATRREFGPQNGRQFGPADVGREVELSGRRMRIAGYYKRGTGLSSSASAILSAQTLQEISPQIGPDFISLGLLKIDRDADLRTIVERLRQVLPDDVDVKTRREVIADELSYWVAETSYGLIFQTGVLLALVVGTAIVYQVLATDVASRLPEYATLKAIGYSNRYLSSVVLQQAMVLAVSGYVLGISLSLLLYMITAAGANVPIHMTWQNAVLVFVLSLVMCVTSGLAALQKAFQADPAELF